jgi:hypothetical protein
MSYCCPDSVRSEKFKSHYGVEGYRVHGQIVDEHGEKIVSHRVQIAYELIEPRNPEFRAVFFDTCEKKWYDEMSGIAGTFRRLRSGNQ